MLGEHGGISCAANCSHMQATTKLGQQLEHLSEFPPNTDPQTAPGVATYCQGLPGMACHTDIITMGCQRCLLALLARLVQAQMWLGLTSSNQACHKAHHFPAHAPPEKRADSTLRNHRSSNDKSPSLCNCLSRGTCRSGSARTRKPLF